MANLKLSIAATTAYLLLLTTVHSIEANPFEFMAQAGKGIIRVGIHTMCLADLVNDADIIALTYAAYDKSLAGIKENSKGPLTEEKLAAAMQILIGGTSEFLQDIDSKCAAVTSYCPSATQSLLSDLGKDLQIMGETLICLVANAKPEVLVEIPGALGSNIERVVSTSLESTTAVNVFQQTVHDLVQKLQKYSSSCANIAIEC